MLQCDESQAIIIITIQHGKKQHKAPPRKYTAMSRPTGHTSYPVGMSAHTKCLFSRFIHAADRPPGSELIWFRRGAFGIPLHHIGVREPRTPVGGVTSAGTGAAVEGGYRVSEPDL